MIFSLQFTEISDNWEGLVKKDFETLLDKISSYCEFLESDIEDAIAGELRFTENIIRR